MARGTTAAVMMVATAGTHHHRHDQARCFSGGNHECASRFESPDRAAGARRFFGEPGHHFSRGDELRFGSRASFKVDIKRKREVGCASDAECFEWLETEGYIGGGKTQAVSGDDIKVDGGGSPPSARERWTLPPMVYRDEATIPQRKFLYGYAYARGFVSAIIGDWRWQEH